MAHQRQQGALAGRIKESIDDAQENVVSSGNDTEQRLVYLVFERGKKVSFDEMGSKTVTTGNGLNQSSSRSGASDNDPDDPAMNNYDEDEYAYSSFSPGC